MDSKDIEIAALQQALRAANGQAKLAMICLVVAVVAVVMFWIALRSTIDSKAECREELRGVTVPE